MLPVMATSTVLPADLEERLSALVGLFVLFARRRAGLSQREVAERTGLTRPSITNIEAGYQRPPLAQLVRIAHVLGVADYRSLLPSLEEMENLRLGHLDPDPVRFEEVVVKSPPRASRVLPPVQQVREWITATATAAAEPEPEAKGHDAGVASDARRRPQGSRAPAAAADASPRPRRPRKA